MGSNSVETPTIGVVVHDAADSPLSAEALPFQPSAFSSFNSLRPPVLRSFSALSENCSESSEGEASVVPPPPTTPTRGLSADVAEFKPMGQAELAAALAEHAEGLEEASYEEASYEYAETQYDGMAEFEPSSTCFVDEGLFVPFAAVYDYDGCCAPQPAEAEEEIHVADDGTMLMPLSGEWPFYGDGSMGGLVSSADARHSVAEGELPCADGCEEGDESFPWNEYDEFCDELGTRMMAYQSMQGNWGDKSRRLRRRYRGWEFKDRLLLVSKTLTQILRHKAMQLKLYIRPDGYISVVDVLNCSWCTDIEVSFEELMYVSENNDKKRFSTKDIGGELWIRANQGHSMKIVNNDELLTRIDATNIPPICVHGTYLKFWESIKRKGLLAGGSGGQKFRRHLHFAPNLPGEEGVISGMRQNCQVAIYMDMEKALDAGISFFVSSNNVILTEGIDGVVPAEYFKSAKNLTTGEKLWPLSANEMAALKASIDNGSASSGADEPKPTKKRRNKKPSIRRSTGKGKGKGGNKDEKSDD